MAKEAIFLTYMGGVSNLSDVKPFLYRVFSDKRALNLHVPECLQKLIAYIMATMRTPKAKKHYATIGGGSPVVRYSVEQAQLIGKRLNIKAFAGMCYSEPFISNVARNIIAYKPDVVYILSLYPQFSRATSGVCFEMVNESLKGMEKKIVKSWCRNPFYVRWIQNSISESIKDMDKPYLLFSAHSLPISVIKAGDVYQKEIEETVRLVMKAFRGVPFSISYQSKVGPIKWLEPSTPDTIRELASEGIRSLVVFPISFVSEHIETLYEIDVEYASIARKLGVNFKRVKLDHKNPLLIEALSSEIEKLRETR
jgi:ferrochelatase